MRLGHEVGARSEPPEPRASSRRDAGVSMIEVLVAVVLLATVGVGVLSSLATAARGASLQRDIAAAQASLATAADTIGENFGGYRSCGTSSASEIATAYRSAIDAARDPESPPVAVTAVRFWNGSAFADVCATGAGHRLQQVVLSALAAGEPVTLTVVIRPSTAPTTALGPLVPLHSGGSTTVTRTPGLGAP